MRLKSLKNHAIISDINSSDTRVPIGHGVGINVLYANGAAKWIYRSIIDPQLKGEHGNFVLWARTIYRINSGTISMRKRSFTDRHCSIRAACGVG